MERCRNPFKKCRHRDIAVYIYFEGKLLPICSRCWREIARSNIEWSYE